MILEFIGLPASGKSTLARKLVDYDTQDIFRFQLDKLYNKSWIQRNMIKLFTIIKFFCGNHQKSYELFRFILETKQTSLFDVLRLFFNNLYIYYNYKECLKITTKISIFDEGLFHHLWAIIATAQNNVNKDVYFQILDINMNEVIVINVKCDIELIRKRLQKRGYNKRHLIMINKIDKMNKLIDESLQDIFLNQFIVINNNEKSQINKNLKIILDTILT